ncbi:hypothetical protein U14_00918 [Candidatus Moduliflexus flocculans]|uniref:Lipoprotein n=1 Tax=Candidatus Moduliflexus flocculans TaxID=1499966 RepID=A0A0S6VV61_9BACT|nr:hypothetical protein U14_00918 [Candidatus Moduliflexus flocculans]
MKRMAYLKAGIALLLVMFAISGCMLFDSTRQNTPVSPVGDATQMQNFWVGRGQDKYEVSSSGEQLEVSVPQGSYILEYTTTYGTFYIVFKALFSVTLFIGLESGDVAQDVYLYTGEISDDVEPIQENDLYKVYELPAEEEASDWYNSFTGEMDVIVLMTGGMIFLEEDEGEDAGENDDAVVGGKWTVTAIADGAGTIKPETKMVPNGASISLKIRPNSRNFADILNVTITQVTSGVKTDVTSYVQQLGNGDGHLVIHGVDDDLEVAVKFGNSPKVTVKPPKTPKAKK